MINNALELTKFLCQQAQNSGFVKAGIIIVLDNDGSLHKTEFGLIPSDFSNQEEKPIEMIPVE